MYEKIKKWYVLRFWTADMVSTAAKKGLLTQQQAVKILMEEAT